MRQPVSATSSGAPLPRVDATNQVSTNSLADLPWWAVFKDPTLQDLIRVALTNNYDLRVIVARVDQARAIQVQARSQFLPQVGYGGEANRGKNEYLGLPVPNGGQTMNSFLAGFGAVWEIDLWGRVRRMNEAARANFMATQEGRRAVMISVVSGVARAYFELLELDQQLRSRNAPRIPTSGLSNFSPTSMPAAWHPSSRFPEPNSRCERSRQPSRKSSAKSRSRKTKSTRSSVATPAQSLAPRRC